MSASVRPYLSRTAYLTPREKQEGKEASMHVVIPHGRGVRSITVPLTRADLLVMIANAADALRLMEEDG